MPDAHAVRELFDRLWPLPPDEREVQLRLYPQPSIAADVRRLLDSYDRASVLDRSPVQQAGAEPAIPAHIGLYRIESELGRGGMGVVYRATRSDDSYRKTVAIKVVGGGMPAEVFKRERQIMASLDHPNIARLHDGGATESGALYFVMEYVEGEPLNQYIQKAGLDVRARLMLFHQICEAVEYAHRNLVVHRDLKPGNVLINREGVVKLLDFGIAKVLEPGLDPSTTAPSGMTPRYASPEQLSGKPINIGSDIYSLGVLLFEMLSEGIHPFDVPDHSLGSYVDAVLNREPRRLSQVVKIDRDLEFVASKAMARDVELRYETVAQLRQDIESYLAGMPVAARPASLGYRARKFAARNRALVALAAALALAVAGGVGATVREYRIANRERTAAVRAATEARQLAEQREQLRIQAENHAAEAARERVRAESSAGEALQQRDSARQRLATAQSLASSIIFDAYDGVRDLPGKADAKVKIVDKTLQNLERLLSQSPGDPTTMDLLANAYQRAGDISSGLAGEGIDNTGAVKYYRRLVELREQAAHSGTAASPFAIPLARIHLANAIGRLLRTDEAMAQAGRAIQEFESLPPPARSGIAGKKARLTLYDFACELTGFNNLVQEALRYCTQASEMADAADLSGDPKVLLVRGANFAKLSVLARTNGKPAEAARFLATAMEYYISHLKAHPDSADAQRGLAVIAGRYAVLLDDSGNADAIESYEKATAALSKIVAVVGQRTQPEQVLAWIHMRFARLLHRLGNGARAKDEAQKSLAMYAARTSGASPTAVDLNDHADNLMKCPIPELQNAPEALRLAKRAIGLLNSPSVVLLDTLANAMYLNGQKQEAVATIKQALDLLDKKPVPALRVEVEASLQKFLSGQ